ncbi:TIGR02266 family protein, partial [Corallococcus sp. 4LFB]|uniref:TIGR02266 family protein n=1 Tax=Corallococcus sp. 4LFB TaxID=3383249 RepID=UPI0039749A77
MTGPAPKLLPLRIRLPYTEEEEFIERYGSNVGRGGVFVATKALKPEGTGLAFEFVLADGTRLLRGEGVVAKAQPDAGSPRTGMTVRFTRLDAASKALIERIVARRSGTEAVASPPAAPRAEAAPLPPGLVRRAPAVNPPRPAARAGTVAVPAAPAPLAPPAKASREETETRAATPKASMTLPAVTVPAAVTPPDLAEPDEPVSLFPEDAVEEEEGLAPLPEVGPERKARRNPPGEGAQRATQEMFTVQPTVPESTGARPPAASGTFAAVMPPPVEAGWEGAGPADQPEEQPPLESTDGAGEAEADAPSWEAPGTAEALGTNALSESAAADEGRAEASPWEQPPTEARSAASEWDASAPEARTDEALPREPGAAETPDDGDASAPVHFTPASVEAFDPNAVLGAPHAPEHPEGAAEASLGEPGDLASEGTPGEAAPERVEAAPAPDASFDFDVDLSMEPEEEPAPAEPGSSFAPDSNPAEGDAEAHGAWAAPDSDADGAGAEATPPPVDPPSAATDADAMGGAGETPPPPEPVATPNQQEADRLRAWGIDPDSLPHEVSTASEDVDPFSAALEQAVEATAPTASEDASTSLADEPGHWSNTEPVLGSPAFTTSATAPTEDQGPSGPDSAPPRDEEESSTVVVVDLPTEDAWTALVGSAAPAPPNDPTAAEGDNPFATDAALADDASPESERALGRATGHEAALTAASPPPLAPDEVSSVVTTPDEAEARSTSATVASSTLLEETLSASPGAPATELHQEASPQSVSTTAVADSSTALASDTKPSVEGAPGTTTALLVPGGTSVSPAIDSQPVPDEATQPAAARAPGATEAASPASAGSEQLPERTSTATEPPRDEEAAAPHGAASDALPSQALSSTEPPRDDEAVAPHGAASDSLPSQASAATESPRDEEAAAPHGTASDALPSQA